MAKENTVYLYGIAMDAPRCKMTAEGEYVSGKLILHTTRRSYATENMELRGKLWDDYPCIFSKNEYIVRKFMTKIKKGDMVRIKGTLCTQEVKKRFLCPSCNEMEIKEGVAIYIDPIFITTSDEHKMETFNTEIETLNKRLQELQYTDNPKQTEQLKQKSKEIQQRKEEEGIRLLHKNQEVSDEIRIMGTLCREPVYYENPETKRMECDFQIASNRIRRILEDSTDKRTDYPWVKTFGAKAAEYAKALHINSTIYITGAIQVRFFEREVVCPNCGHTYKRQENATEIVPYNIEYIKNCIIPEEEEETYVEE